jgi:hypothetical protein
LFLQFVLIGQLEHLARLGYASKAVVFGIVGILAILTAARRSGAVTDTSGALRVLRLPFGQVPIVVLAIGLYGYAAGRLVDAIADPDGAGTSPGDVVTRRGNIVPAAFTGRLAWTLSV